jgi:hypothetical protein
MITPAYSLTATERILPKLSFDFTAAVLPAIFTFTRTGNTATVTDSSGQIVAVSADQPRFLYDPVTLVCKGLLIEEARTNLLLNSLIDGTDLATQTVTTTAAAHTLSFYGSGAVELSGTFTTTIVGAGAYPARTTLTFTPTAGSLTLTVTGTVQFAQLEEGGYATSFIPTAASQVTRTADICDVTGTNFSDNFSVSDGSFFCAFRSLNNLLRNRLIYTLNDGSTQNYVGVGSRSLSDVFAARIRSLGGTVTNLGANFGQGTDAPQQTMIGIQTNNIGLSFRGLTTEVAAVATPPGINRLFFGGFTSVSQSFELTKFSYWPQRVKNAELQAFSK